VLINKLVLLAHPEQAHPAAWDPPVHWGHKQKAPWTEEQLGQAHPVPCGDWLTPLFLLVKAAPVVEDTKAVLEVGAKPNII